MTTTSLRTIVGLGEALFDIYGDEARLGGAPLNLAVHAQQLGNRGVVVSRIGQDELGARVVDELRRRGMTVEHLQTDPDHATGTVLVELDAGGEPSYNIVRDVAWDAMQWDPDLETIARTADAVCFGTLSQRDGQTRSTVYRFLEAANKAVRLLDVNLRQHYYDRRILTRSLELATAVKLNAGELRVLADTFQLGPHADEAAPQLLRQFPNLKWIALTRGAEGTVVFTPGAKHDAAPVALVGKMDAVGAGDSAAAALLHGVLRRWPWDKTLTLANTIGAYVAGQPGACPPLPDSIRALAAG